jgi:phosphomannomutase / phosphoglucomutase
MPAPAFIFREYDIRGVADRDLTDDTTRAIGRALGGMLEGRGGKPPRLALGRDCRMSSPRLHAAMLEGLLESGADVIDIGVGPTPHLYFGVFHGDTDGGVMITGSHNPAEDNGFKVMRGKASFFGKDIQDLCARVQAGGGSPAKTRGTVTKTDVMTAYVDTLSKAVKVNPTLKFVVDAGNGAGGPAALAAMAGLGLHPDPLFCEMDGHFPHHHPDPTVPKNLEALIARVKATGARVGLAYDGDADRLGAVDANGDIVWGDRLLILFSRALLKENPGAAILGEVKCSQTLYDDIAAHGGRPIMWKTGHSLIKTKMKEEHALLAGEMSGHLFFADRYFGYDDAVYASLRLLEILSQDGRTIGEMLSDVPKTFTTPEIRVDCPEAIKFDVVRKVTEHYVKAGKNVIGIDGARIQFGQGAAKGGVNAWGLVRASNTGPILVMRFEAGSEAERDAIRAEVEGVVHAERQRLSAQP